MPKRQQNGQGSKLQTVCGDQAAASYKCLEKAMGDGSQCSMYFEAYKSCKAEERARIIEEKKKSFE